MKKLIFLTSILFCYTLIASESSYTPRCALNPCEPGGKYDHWFTGPIFTPNPTTVSPGHPVIEPVLIASCTYGLYDDSWHTHSVSKMLSVGPYVDFQASFSEKVGVELIGFLVTNFRDGANSTHLRDTIFRMGFQVSNDQQDSWIPDFRILFQETFPTGKYDKLNPRKRDIDLTGNGAFETGLHFAFQKLFPLGATHCLSIRGDVGYFFPSLVSVQGLNHYTGLFNVKGKIRPGQVLRGYLTLECSISAQWNVCCETFYQYQQNGHFSGKVKAKDDGSRAHVKVPATAQLLVAPEIEHTITPNVGIIIGSAATVFGKNAPAFYSAFVAVLYLF
jgi:hypothetical protein